MRRYRWIMTGVAMALLLVAGVMVVMDNSEVVMQEKSVGDSDGVYYSDSFFFRPNSKYDHELARASLALSVAAFHQEQVEEYLSDLEYEGTVFYRYGQKNDEDRVAFAISHKNVPAEGALNDKNSTSNDGLILNNVTPHVKTIIVIAVRGGKYGDEWGSNGRVGYNGESFGYHYGFHKAAGDAIVQLKEYAADKEIVLQDSVIWITGFSRGAAVANVMGAMLTGQAAVPEKYDGTSGDSEQGYNGGSGNWVTIRPENLFDYTFASPNTVSEDLITGISETNANKDPACRGIYNIVNPLDIVTRLPMNARGISKTAKGKTVRYNWNYTKYGTTLNLPTGTESSRLQVVQLLENALSFATRNESRYVERTQDQVIIPALKKTMGKGADVSKRNIGYVLVDSLPGVATFLKNEVNKLDLKAQIYVAGILSGQNSIQLEKEHWPKTYWDWMMKEDGLERQE